MNDHRDLRISSDFSALVRVTNSNQKSLEQFIEKGAELREQQSRKVDGMFISASKRFVLATAAVAVVAAVLFFIPVSYGRIVGWEATLNLSAGRLDPEQLQFVARELKTELGADAVRLELEQNEAGENAVMRAFVGAKNSADPAAKLEAFAKFLSGKGYKASSVSRPRVEEASSSVAAMTLERVIRIEEEGKTPEELEDEIIARLREAGIKDIEVTVTKEDGDKTRIEIEANCRKDVGVETDSACPQGMPELVLTKDGEIPDRERVMVKVAKEMVDGVEDTVFMIDLKGQKATVRIGEADELSDGEFVKKMEEQLKAQGIALAVTVAGGELKIGPYSIGPINR